MKVSFALVALFLSTSALAAPGSNLYCEGTAGTQGVRLVHDASKQTASFDIQDASGGWQTFQVYEISFQQAPVGKLKVTGADPALVSGVHGKLALEADLLMGTPAVYRGRLSASKSSNFVVPVFPIEAVVACELR